MSLESQVARLADALEENNKLLAAHGDAYRHAFTEGETAFAGWQGQATPVDVRAKEQPEVAEEAEIDTTPTEVRPEKQPEVAEAPVEPPAEPEIVWYHDPAKKAVWSEEGPARRRKGIIKIDPATAERLQAQYAAEAEEAEAGEPETDLSLDDDEPAPAKAAKVTAPEYSDEDLADDTAWGKAFNDWSGKAVAHTLAQRDDDDNAAAEMDVKRFIVPMVKEYMATSGKPSVTAIPAERRVEFITTAYTYFD